MTARILLGLGIGLLLSAVAAPALAAGGNLEPFPDLLSDCLAGDCKVLEDPFSALFESMWIRLIVGFLILIPISNKMVFEPMLTVLDERDARIAGATARAGEAGSRADEVLGRYQEAVTAARKEADEIRRETLDGARRSQARVTAEARSDALRQVADVRAEVVESAEQARAQLRADSELLARTVAEQVLGRAL